MSAVPAVMLPVRIPEIISRRSRLNGRGELHVAVHPLDRRRIAYLPVSLNDICVLARMKTRAAAMQMSTAAAALRRFEERSG